jgi:hypothetical protein
LHATIGQELESSVSFGISWLRLGLNRSTSMEWTGPMRAVYIVLGVFERGHTHPRETVVFVPRGEHLIHELRRGAFRLRGLTGTFLSLKHIKGFGLYKVYSYSRSFCSCWN